MAVVAAGGKPPYAYTWKKAGSTVSGQTSDTFNKATAVSGDAGDYTCVVTDSSSPVKTVNSACLPPLLSVNGDAGLSRHG